MNIDTNMNAKSNLTFYDLLLLWIGVVSALVVITLSLGRFSPPVILIGSVVVILATLAWIKVDPIKEIRFDLVFWALLFLALLFRYSNATHYVGGQDQGVYVNMADDLAESGKIQFVDKLRESLPEDLQAQYDSITEPGVGGVDNPETSEYSVDFYPMHPAWMAIATFLFGEGKHILSLLFFSLIGLVGMYLLTMELTGNDNKAGYLSLLFGALNPGLVYFSTFPVGEMVALCFSVNGFYLLSRGFRCEDKRLRWLLLMSSALLFSAFCYTRMTLFVFFPIFIVILFISFFFEKYSHLRLPLSIYLVSLAVLFALSWAFYNKYLYELAFAMRVAVFNPLLDSYNMFVTVGVVFTIVLLYAVSQTNLKGKLFAMAESLSVWLEGNAAFFVFAVLALSFVFIPQLYTEGINARVVIEPYPLIFQFSSVYYLMLFISPVLLFVMFVFSFFRFRLQGSQILLLFFLFTTWLIILIQYTYNDYLYYFGRYFCSEMVPYSLIFCGMALSLLLNTAKWRNIAIALTGMAVVYFIIFSSVQIGHAETENPETLYELDRLVGNTDVIIYENVIALGDSAHGIHNHGLLLTTPLKLYFDKQVYRLQRTLLTDEEHSRIINYFYDNSAENSGLKYGIIYILTHEAIIYDTEDALTLVGRFDYSFGRLINPHQYKTTPLNEINTWKQLLLPYHYSVYRVPVYLYRVDKRLGTLSITDFSIDFSQDGNSVNFDLTGISPQERTFRWTDGNNATISALVSPAGEAISKCQLRIVADVYVNGKNPTQSFSVKVNGAEVGKVEDGISGEFLFDVPVELVNNTNRITIELILPDANSPSAIGGSDVRLLGLALKEVQLIIDQ